MGIGRAGIEECGGGMCEVPLGHEGVRFEDFVNVIEVDAHRDTHEHMLWPFHNLPMEFQEIGFFQRLESKIIKFKIPVMDQCRIQNRTMLWIHDHVIDLLGDEGCRFVGFGVSVVE